MNNWQAELEIVFFFFSFFGPVNLVGLVGAIVALMRLRSYGRSARLVAIGAGLVLFSTLLFIACAIPPSQACINSILGSVSHKTREAAAFGIWTTMMSIGIGFIMWAAVTDRTSDAESE